MSKKSLKKGRSNCLFVLPAQLAISKGGGGGKEEVLAYMQKMSSPSPELVVETHEVGFDKFWCIINPLHRLKLYSLENTWPHHQVYSL